ncbi:MAG: large exoprotein [Actinomycetota bacterium]
MYSDYSGLSMAFFAVYALVILVFLAAGYILTSLFYMKVFEKAGVEGKWRAWVPVYNSMIFVKLGDLNPWVVLIAIGATILLGWVPVIGWLIGVAAFAVSVLAAWRVGLKLQKEAAWVILYIFLAIVWLGINAFDKSRWNTQIAPAPWAGNGFLGDRTTWNGIPAQTTNVAPGSAAPQGYGAAPQGYAPPQGYTPPAAPTAPGAPPVPPAAPTSAPTNPPVPPVTPPAPAAPPATPPAPPAAPPAPPAAPPTNPTQPPA